MGTLNGYTVLSFVVPFLLLPKTRAWILVIASVSSGGASLFACRVRARACVYFTILSAGVTVGVLFHGV